MKLRIARCTLTTATAGVAAALTPALAVAHAGPHEPTAETMVHALTQADHLLALFAIVTAVVAMAAGYRFIKGRFDAHRAARE